MSRRNKILIVLIVIVVILALIYWLFLRPGYLPPESPESSAVNTGALPSGGVALPAVNVSPTVPEIQISDSEKTRSDISRLAASFAERFGSYSNQGNFENILDLKVLMTEKMQQWADDFIERNKAGRGDTAVYSGVTTKAISTDINNLDENGGYAEITVGTQKQETSGSMAGNQRVYYQNLMLKFRKIGDDWKVDEATWEPTQ